MPEISIVPCRLAHLHEVAANLRTEERFELAELGIVSRHVMRQMWRDTIEPRAGLVGDEVVAVWGDAAGILAPVGQLWLFTSVAADRIPFAFARVARREIERMLAVRQTIRSSVHKACPRAVRFYRMLGFELIDGTMREGFLEIRMSR